MRGGCCGWDGGSRPVPPGARCPHNHDTGGTPLAAFAHPSRYGVTPHCHGVPECEAEGTQTKEVPAHCAHRAVLGADGVEDRRGGAFGADRYHGKQTMRRLAEPIEALIESDPGRRVERDLGRSHRQPAQ